MSNNRCLEGLEGLAFMLDRNRCDNIKEGLETFMKVPNGAKKDCKEEVKKTRHKNIKNFIKFCIENKEK